MHKKNCRVGSTRKIEEAWLSARFLLPLLELSSRFAYQLDFIMPYSISPGPNRVGQSFE